MTLDVGKDGSRDPASPDHKNWWSQYSKSMRLGGEERKRYESALIRDAKWIFLLEAEVFQLQLHSARSRYYNKNICMLCEVAVLLFTWSLLFFWFVPAQNRANPTLMESIGRLESWWSLCLAACWIYSINPFIFENFSAIFSPTAVWSPGTEETWFQKRNWPKKWRKVSVSIG